jgi:dolichyl-phosphate-mannose--protein O-mannosyl transferase
MGRRLAGPRWVAALAALLVSVDGLALTMSRIAMLDGIQAAFVTVGALFALYDRRSAHRRWRWAAGITLGIGVAVKWSSASVLVLAVGLALFTELSSRRRSGGPSLLATAARVAVPLVAVPAAIYVVSYAGWFASVDRSETGRDRCGAGCSIAEALSGWGFEQWDMVDVQRRLEPTHPDRSKPLAWLTLSRPVLTYAAACPPGPAPDDDCDVAPGTQARIFGVGNPALWWPALLAYPSLGWLALRRRDGPAAFVLACIAVQVLPWFASWKPGFAFYMTPVVPFIALALALSLARATGRWPPARVLPVAIAVAAIAGAIWLYPIWTGIELSPSALDARLWFAD